MANNAALHNFFAFVHSDPIAGLTFKETGGALSYVNVIALEQTSLGTLTNDQLEEATIHEYGHAIDFTGAVGGETSGSLAYTSAISDDKSFLDNAGQPCQAAGTGPFNGVVDYQTGLQFCSGGTLNNPGGIYTGKTNSQIAAISQPGILGSQPETYAQVFAYEAYVNKFLANKTGFVLTEVANGLLQKGYYDCAQVVGAQAAGTAYVRAHTYSCN